MGKVPDRFRLGLAALLLASLLVAPSVRAGSGGSVSGTAFHLDGSPVVNATMQCTLPPSARSATAELRVFALSPSKKGYVVRSPAGSVHSVPFGRNAWTTVNVTTLVASAGKLTLLLSDATPTAIKFAGLS